MGSNKLFVALTSLTCLGLGKVQASLASALGFDRFGFVSASCSLSLLFTARFRYRSSSYGTLSKATGFLLIARFCSPALPIEISTGDFFISLRTAICSKQISKSSEMNL